MNLEEIIGKQINQTNNYLKELLEDRSDPPELYEPVKYHLEGGKRVRPALCLLACEAISGDGNSSLPLAAGFELIHAFTLAHDDIMDQDVTRRGKATLYSKYGEPYAIIAGDAIFTLSYLAASKLELDPSLMVKGFEILSESILMVCEGQSLDISFENRKTVSMDEYMDMAYRKTGVLIKGACKGGALIGGGNEAQVKALSEYGEKLGLAFQIWDDYIDFASTKTGKTFGSDIKKGKKTSIVIYALDRAEHADKERLKEILAISVDDTANNLVQEAVEILNKVGAIEFAKERANYLIDEAKNAIKILPDSEAKEKLMDFADFVVNREH